MTDIRNRLSQYIPNLKRYARSLVRDASEVDDLVQSCLVLAIYKQSLYKEDIDLRAWLFTILRNHHINNIRSRNRRAGIELFVENIDATYQETATSALLLRDLKRALNKLSPDQLVSVMLVGLEGVTYEEASEILCIPLGTVRSRVHRGRLELRDAMQWDQT